MVSKTVHDEDGYSSGEDEKPLSMTTARSSANPKHSSCLDSELIEDDSDDERPLSYRLRLHTDARASSSSRGNIAEEPNCMDTEPNDGDSDDEKPLSVRLRQETDARASSSRCNISEEPSCMNSEMQDGDSDDEKPLSLRFQLNTDANAYCSKSNVYVKRKESQLKNGNQSRMASGVSKKRPAPEPVSCQNSVKKSKLLDVSTPLKSAKSSRVRGDDDGADARPSRTVKKSKNKQKLSSKANTKSKKTGKKSQYARSMEKPPKSRQGKCWTTLVHNGVCFPSPYTQHGVKMLYNGLPVDLSPEQEEVATMYASKLETDYVNNPIFNENFFSDWRKILGRNHVIQDLKRCDFTPIQQWILREKENQKQKTSQEKAALREQKSREVEKYMWAIVDGEKEKVGTFRVEPPGLFVGRGLQPKNGALKKRILPRDVVINIGKESPIPECPVPGERWKEVIHDNTVTWLARYDDPIKPNSTKYVFLAASSNLKGKKDMEKYEKARELKKHIHRIRESYEKDFRSKDMSKKQIAVATYLIDRLALRAGNEKDDDEADTVGCCTLKVENVKPISPNILELDFLGKDSIRFFQKFEAEPLVFKAIEDFQKGKQGEDELFDKLDSAKLNAHLKEFMPGLTAKVFRTYNASLMLDELLREEARSEDVSQKVDIYRQANKKVAILCNHQRSVPKSHSALMVKRSDKINELKTKQTELQREKNQTAKGNSPEKKRNSTTEALQKKIIKINEMIRRIEREMQAREDMKTIALGTSKTNYLDPRITAAWCKRNEVPIEKVYSKSEQAKFIWAMDVDPTFTF